MTSYSLFSFGSLCLQNPINIEYTKKNPIFFHNHYCCSDFFIVTPSLKPVLKSLCSMWHKTCSVILANAPFPNFWSASIKKLTNFLINKYLILVSADRCNTELTAKRFPQNHTIQFKKSRTYEYWLVSLCPTSGECSFWTKIRMMQMKRMKFTCWDG